MQITLDLSNLDKIVRSNSEKESKKESRLSQTDSRTSSDHYSQTDSIKMNNKCIQTNSINDKQDRSVETDKTLLSIYFNQVNKESNEAQTQTDFRPNNLSAKFSGHYQSPFNSSSKRIQSLTPQTLYTYKAYLSPLNESYSSESTPTTQSNIYEETFGKKLNEQTKFSNCTNFKSNESQACDQTFSTSKSLPNFANLNKTRATMNKLDESRKWFKCDKYSTNNDIISSCSSIYSSPSDSFYYHKMNSTQNQTLTKQWSKNVTKEKNPKLRVIHDLKENETYHFSSPDLGIGDCDHDLNRSLRAYIKLGHYQLLRTNLNQISSYLSSLEKLNKDRFIFQLINDTEYINQIKPFLNNLKQMMNASKSICKQFSIEDEGPVLNQFEDIKRLKENIEKAITQQLNKTDKLLKKAKLNIKSY